MGIFDGIFKPNIKKMAKNRDMDGLIKVLNYEKDWKIREKAAMTLGYLGMFTWLDDFNPLGLATDPLYLGDRFMTKAKEICFFGEKVLEALTDSLKDNNPEVRIQAAKSIGRIWKEINDKSTIIALEISAESNKEVKQHMLKILSMFEKAKISLKEALGDNNDGVSKQAAITLQKLDKNGVNEWLSN